MTHVIGVDLGGTFIKSAIIDTDGKVVTQRKDDTGKRATPEEVVQTIARAVETGLDENGIAKETVRGCGIGCPGPLDSKTGTVFSSPNLQGWKDVPLRQMLSDALSLPVGLYNDANAAAYGEYWQGAGKGTTNFVLYTLGTGIGGGLILNGRLYTGSGGMGGELGHQTLIPDGPRCGCGNNGCLEALASAPAVVRRTRKKMSAGAESILRDSDAQPLTSERIHAAATRGDQLATEVLARTGRYLGIAAAFMVNALNPEVIAYSGGMSRAGEYLFPWIRSEAKKRSFPELYAGVRIVPATLGNDAGFLGAAGLFLAE